MTTPTPSRAEQSRAEFEAWAKANDFDIFHGPSGRYSFKSTQSAWLAWSAREERVAELEARLEQWQKSNARKVPIMDELHGKITALEAEVARLKELLTLAQGHKDELRQTLADTCGRLADARKDSERLDWLLDRAKVRGGGDGAKYEICFTTTLDTECDRAALDQAREGNNQTT